MKKIHLLNKKIRSKVIKEYLGEDKCFCFSCGNAVEALQKEGVKVVPISLKNKLSATEYISPTESKFYFECFNATSGYLPIFLIEEISERIKEELPSEMFDHPDQIYVPVGSGETYLAFSYLFEIDRLMPFKSNYPPIRFNMSPLIKLITTQTKVKDFGDLTIKQIWNKIKGEKGYFIYTEHDRPN